MKTKKPRNVNVTPDRRFGNGLIIAPRHSPSRPELNLLWLALSSHRQVRNKLSSYSSGKRSRSKTGHAGQAREGHPKAQDGRAAPCAGRAGLPTSPGRHRLPRSPRRRPLPAARWRTGAPGQQPPRGGSRSLWQRRSQWQPSAGRCHGDPAPRHGGTTGRGRSAPRGSGGRARALPGPPPRSRRHPAEGAASARQRPAGPAVPAPEGRRPPPTAQRSACCRPAGAVGGALWRRQARKLSRCGASAALPLSAGLTALPRDQPPNFAERDRPEVGRRDRAPPPAPLRERSPAGGHGVGPRPAPPGGTGRLPAAPRAGSGRPSPAAEARAPAASPRARRGAAAPSPGRPRSLRPRPHRSAHRPTCKGSSPPGALKSSLPGDAARSRGGGRGRCCPSRNPPRRGQHPPSGAGADGAPVIPAAAAETSPRGGLPAAGRAAWGGGRPGAAGGGSQPFLPARSGRLSRAPERGRGGGGAGGGGGRAGGGQGKAGQQRRVPTAATRPPPCCRCRRRRRAEASPGRGGPRRAEPSRPPRRARPCPVSRAATDSRPAPALPLGMCGRRGRAGLGPARFGSVRRARATATARPWGGQRPRPERGSTAGPWGGQQPWREAGNGRAALAADWGGGEVRGEVSLRLGSSQSSPTGKTYKFQQLDPKWLRSHSLGSVSKSLTRPSREKSCCLFADTGLAPRGDADPLGHGGCGPPLLALARLPPQAALLGRPCRRLRLPGSRAQSRLPE